MARKKEKTFLPPLDSGKSVESGGKRTRECREGCGFVAVLKSLLRHSASTGATSVTIRIDLEYPYLQIADNGSGIPQTGIGEIGKTTFLDLITAAEEVLIETMTRSMEKSAVMKFRNKVLLAPKNTALLKKGGETFGWLQPSTSTSHGERPKAIPCSPHQRDSVGTTVALTNIQLSLKERIEQLARKIVNLVRHFAIVHYHMSITLRNIKGNKLLFGTKKAKSITEKVASIYNLDNMEFDSISRSSDSIAIEIFWGRKFHHSAGIQMVFINGEACSNARLLKTIKRAWRCGGKKHPVYILCITIKSLCGGSVDNLSHDSVIKNCIEECVVRWKNSCDKDEEDFFFNDDDASERSVYAHPHLWGELKKLNKKKNSAENCSVVFKSPAPVPQRIAKSLIKDVTPANPHAMNLTMSPVRSARQYLRTEESFPLTRQSRFCLSPSALVQIEQLNSQSGRSRNDSKIAETKEINFVDLSPIKPIYDSQFHAQQNGQNDPRSDPQLKEHLVSGLSNPLGNQARMSENNHRRQQKCESSFFDWSSDRTISWDTYCREQQNDSQLREQLLSGNQSGRSGTTRRRVETIRSRSTRFMDFSPIGSLFCDNRHEQQNDSQLREQLDMLKNEVKRLRSSQQELQKINQELTSGQRNSQRDEYAPQRKRQREDNGQVIIYNSRVTLFTGQNAIP
ncbi:uncharacterized protein LOC132258074 [Phlebotomus argentipes]|uniref:uncharacterized protein LOC132258074 n=1 Tax=Phlebotomus argentipes TaxID=94469 RepID=UPI0028935308|nr:uncharacterized protein LOC132258074 [Phlebotomus argentipes]